MDATAGHALGALESPERNSYFYGKLLDEAHFRMEQSYFNRKRWLINRLEFGVGVLCGLAVTRQGDVVCIAPGVAIDGHGREIVVPRAVTVDPWKLVDERGAPAGELPREAGGRRVTICLAYRECATEFVPVMVADCDTADRCAPSTIVESFVVSVRDGPAPALPVRPRAGLCDALASGASATERAHALCELWLAEGCTVPRASGCVVLATVDLGAGGKIAGVDPCTARPVAYGNAALFEMILCLAARIEECCGRPPAAVPTLTYVSGDNQTAKPGEALAAPLVARVTKSGVPTAGESVRFEVTGGGGQVGASATGLATSAQMTSDANGLATLPVWVLGAAAGENTVEARIGSEATGVVAFKATARAVDRPAPLVLERVEFLNDAGAVVGSLSGAPPTTELKAASIPTGIEFTFSRPLDPLTVTTFPGGAVDPRSFSVWVVALVPVIVRAGSSGGATRNLAGTITVDAMRPAVATFRLDGVERTAFDAGDYQLALFGDADAATGRPAISAVDGTRLDGEASALPSGDGTEGGIFFCRFSVV